ncbi:Membrane-associated apoptosis protein [Phytophthora infestans]|uniref:Membrane-associated apoptosis protein n=1 Tax=Phytophthora infestans TaxID=4787 RepID=A0A833WTY6_PHYIN|nr:Membrane-associated apoptosis protein [Phytophthora infestans]
MVSALLDELPCLIDEAGELMARLGSHKTLLKTKRKGATVSISTEKKDLTADVSREDLTQPTSRHSASIERSPSNAKIRQTLDDVDVEFFSRQYLTMQSISYEKVNANLPAADLDRKELYNVAASVYQLMKRLHHWQQAAWETLTRLFSDNSSSDSCLLTFVSHPELTRLVLATVTTYVKVNLLWTSFSIIPALLAVYCYLHHAQTLGGDNATPIAVYSPLEHTDHRVREFVLHFGTAPLLAIQHDFHLQVADKGASLAALALSCFERFEACRDLAKLRQQGVFDLEPPVSGAYASHSSLPDLLNAADVVDWVICVVLCVPHQLFAGDSRTASMSPRSIPSTPSSPSSSSGSPSFLWDFMETVARDRMVFTIHRNHVVNLHDLLYQQVTSSLSIAVLSPETSSIPSFGKNRSAVSLKRSMNSLGKYALRNCGVNHRQRREVAIWLTKNCVQLMQHNPGLVAPSFPLFLAALAIAHDETQWAMCHGVGNSNARSSLLPSHIKAKHLQRVQTSFSGAEREIADLLTHCNHLRRLLEQNSHFLAEYYQTFLLNGDAEGIAYTIHQLLLANESASEFRSLLEGFLDNERYRINTSSAPRATWVREWRQANAHLARRTQLPLLDSLRARMECAVRHTQYICKNAQLIEQTANFSKCWWFHRIIFDQCFEQVLTTAPSSAVGLLEILSSLAAGNYVLDELVETEEATEQSERMIQRMDRMRTSLVEQVELGLVSVVKRDAILQRDEVSALVQEKNEPAEHKVTASNRRLSSFSRVQSSQALRPGSAELRLASPTASVLSRKPDSRSNASSFSANLEHIREEERCLRLTSALLNHIRLDNDMRSAIICRVRSCFVRFMRGIVGTSDSNGAGKTSDGVALRCSLQDACVQIRCFLRASQRLLGGSSELNDMSDVSLGEAVQNALAKDLADECSASTSILPQDKRLLEWTTEFPRVSEKEFEQCSLVDRLSWLYVSLVTTWCHPLPSTTVSSPSVLAAVRKHCFVLAPGASSEVDPRDYTDPEALRHLKTLIGSTGVKSVCSTVANLVVAQTLKLRSLIEAEHAVLAFMDMAMNNSSNADVVLATAQVRALDDIATLLVQIGTAVFLLQLLHDHSPHDTSDAWEGRVAPRLLRELQQDPDRRSTWTRLLPVACSSGFHSSVWKRTTYLSSEEATDTNAHMMGLAMARLIPSPHSSQSMHRCAVSALKRTTADTAQPTAGRSKAHLDPGSSTRPLLEALELLVTSRTSDSSEAQGSALGELELSLERLLPHATALSRVTSLRLPQ